MARAPAENVRPAIHKLGSGAKTRSDEPAATDARAQSRSRSAQFHATDAAPGAPRAAVAPPILKRRSRVGFSREDKIVIEVGPRIAACDRRERAEIAVAELLQSVDDLVGIDARLCR